ncbi:MAG: hypothetical protein KDC92_03650 [Bacteroidetes bacterium]|nr:hypothetical protein [Bacteroidota bacterium]
MSTVKLTLSLNKTVIDAAKKWATYNNTSLSKMVEDYFIKLLKPDDEQDELHPKLIGLRGMAKAAEPVGEYKADIIKYLENKYLNESAD